MLSRSALVAILSLVGASQALMPPTYNNFKIHWQDAFLGSAGTSPSTTNWNIITGDLGVNNELETYTSSPRNIQISGGQTLQIVPWRDASATHGWTSGRIESKFTFTPTSGRITRVESALRFGANQASQKAGIWPAFWMLGDVLRRGGSWPASGEIDIMEEVNGVPTGFGTLHCDVFPGGRCREPDGLSASIMIPNNDFHTWRVEIDRTKASWQDETLKWSLDGAVYHTITGAQIGDANTWSAVAHSALYIIFDLAVGGTFPGNPNDNTLDGFGSMLEVGYVAQYTSSGTSQASVNDFPTRPGTQDGQTPGDESSSTSGTQDGQTPGDESSSTSGTQDGQTPGDESSSTSGTQDGQTSDDGSQGRQGRPGRLGRPGSQRWSGRQGRPSRRSFQS